MVEKDDILTAVLLRHSLIQNLKIIKNCSRAQIFSSLHSLTNIKMVADSQKAPPQPRDARIISLILQSLGVEDYDPKVVHQLLEFAHSKYL